VSSRQKDSRVQGRVYSVTSPRRAVLSGKAGNLS
jgi:hypothetical protein